VLFTKTDLIAGFVEYFDALNKTEREQVWGLTLPLDKGDLGENVVIDKIPTELDLLIDRLNGHLLERLQQEPDIERRSLIYGFPNQIASLSDSIVEVLTEIFRPNRFEQHPLLRGVYFASSTQIGTPIDRMMGAMSAGFGIDPQRLAPFPGQGRSYFLNQLFRRVIFPEAAMVSADPRVMRRQRLLRIAAYATAALLVAGLGTIWTMGYSANRRLIADIDNQLSTYRTEVADLPSSDVSDTDLRKIVPPLDQLRDLPTGLKTAQPDGWLTTGLYQGDKLQFQHDAVYHRALNGLLLPRLLARLQQQMREHANDTDFLLECLKVYLMLGQQAPSFDKDFVRRWLVEDWLETYSGVANAPLRADLAGHYDVLVASPMANMALDAGLIAKVRQILQAVPAANRAYALIKQSQAAHDLPSWRIIDHAGPAADRAFMRKSGKPLTDGIAGLYSYRGFHQVFLPALDNVAKSVAAEAWVRGDVTQEDLANNTFQQEVLSLYLADYATEWQSLLSDVQLVPAPDSKQTLALLNILSGADSPLALFVKSAAKETTLSVPFAADAAGKSENTAPKPEAPPAGNIGQAGLLAQFDEKFRSFRELATPINGGPAPIDDVTHNLGSVYQVLFSQGGAGAPGSIKASDGTASNDIRQLASRLPPPLDGWLGGIGQTFEKTMSVDALGELNKRWSSEVRQFCQNATKKRYPFERDGIADIPIEDFRRLFAPGGLMDSFFNENLKSIVDTSHQQWREQQSGTAPLNINHAALAAFQHAARIREVFFQNNSQEPLIRFELSPVELDATSIEVDVDIDGQAAPPYRHGPIRSTTMQWPAPSGSGSGTRVTFTTPSNTKATSAQTGPWAIFRLLQSSTVFFGDGPDDLRFKLTAGGQHALYDLRLSSVQNPFNLSDLSDFRCPTSF
jgi:type VI secretion system protein ImpL